MIKDKAIAFYSLSLLQNHSLLRSGIIFRNGEYAAFITFKKKREGGRTLWFRLKVKLV